MEGQAKMARRDGGSEEDASGNAITLTELAIRLKVGSLCKR